MKAWVRRLNLNDQEVFQRCYEAIYDDAHVFLQTKLMAKMRILEAIYIKQMLEILDGLLADCSNRSERYLERTFLFALMWTLGAVLEIKEREKLEEFLIKHPSKLSMLYCCVCLMDGTLSYIDLTIVFHHMYNRMAKTTAR